MKVINTSFNRNLIVAEHCWSMQGIKPFLDDFEFMKISSSTWTRLWLFWVAKDDNNQFKTFLDDKVQECSETISNFSKISSFFVLTKSQNQIEPNKFQIVVKSQNSTWTKQTRSQFKLLACLWSRSFTQQCVAFAFCVEFNSVGSSLGLKVQMIAEKKVWEIVDLGSAIGKGNKQLVDVDRSKSFFFLFIYSQYCVQMFIEQAVPQTSAINNCTSFKCCYLLLAKI